MVTGIIAGSAGRAYAPAWEKSPTSSNPESPCSDSSPRVGSPDASPVRSAGSFRTPTCVPPPSRGQEWSPAACWRWDLLVDDEPRDAEAEIW